MSETVVFEIPRATGTHGDVFLVAGLAELLASVAEGPVQLRAHGATYEVRASLVDGWDTRLPVGAGYRYLRPKAKAAVPVGIPSDLVLDYEAERERVAQYYKQRQAVGRKPPADPELAAWLEQNAPRPDWRHWQLLNLLQGDDNTNKVFLRLFELPESTARAAIVQGLRALQQGQPSGLSWGVSSVQLFTPNAAKGYARLKPDSTDRNDKTKEAWVDPFVEWLRYRGYFQVACPFFVDSKAERIRVLTPEPADVSAKGLVTVADKLRRAPPYGAEPKLDALAVLFLARVLIEHSELYQPAEPVAEPPIPLFTLYGKTPAQVISGVAITQYVSMGSARVVAHLGELALPDWFPMESPADAQAWVAILDEHRRVLAGLRDDRSDEIGLLIAYRRFLQARGAAALDALLDFMGAYGPFVLRARELKRRVAQFTTENFRALVGRMMGTYLEILDDPGFRAVAAAVRRATVSAQSLKALGRTDYREIRYDLLPEIRRRRSLPDSNALIETIADFIASYNAENARRRELRQPAPPNVTTEEFRAFALLVEKYQAPLVGALLAAYGSCREPREVAAEPEVSEPTAESEEVLPAAVEPTEGE
ncbi:MAG TPA: hypothetical protein VFB73_05440 [Chloroflexota bacterium]|nr:hypothetical protein [Chloroflexota bacterium]